MAPVALVAESVQSLPYVWEMGGQGRAKGVSRDEVIAGYLPPFCYAAPLGLIVILAINPEFASLTPGLRFAVHFVDYSVSSLPHCLIAQHYGAGFELGAVYELQVDWRR